MCCFLFEPKRTRTVHSFLRVTVWLLLTNAELSVQSQRVHCCAGSQESESTSPFRARTAPRLASADWKRQVTENLHFNFFWPEILKITFSLLGCYKTVLVKKRRDTPFLVNKRRETPWVKTGQDPFSRKMLKTLKTEKC